MTVAATTPTGSSLGRHVTALPGVGPERAALLAKLGIQTIEDLLLHRPRRYEDRQHLLPISKLQLHESACSHGKIVAMGTKWFRQHTKSIFEIILDDGTGRLHCRWWNLPFMEKYFAPGDEVLVFGKLLEVKPRTMDHAETEVIEGGEESSIHLGRLTPVYPLTEGLPQRWLRSLIWRTLQTAETQIEDPWAKSAGSDSKKPTARSPSGSRSPLAAQMPSRARAIRMLHVPERETEPEAARRRLALDEFIELQRQIQQRRRTFEAKSQPLPCEGDNRFIKPFLAGVGFKLTHAQTRVLRELRKDLSGPHPMRRLLQGDVGSGKTVVAACCALMVLECGYDVAVMAPTEILAEQHFQTFSKWLRPIGIPVGLQTGSRKTAAEFGARNPDRALKRQPANPQQQPSTAIPQRVPSLTVGTHALIESGFTPENLGLVIIDEQHKFGVVQREQLVRKGHYPHLLVMTATPIPRTLGLTMYGELDVSVIDHLPPGRGKIRTFIRSADKLPKVWEFMRSRLAEGRQAYVVYPRVEDGGTNGIKAVTQEYEKVCEAMSPYQVGLLHGRLRAREKEEVMASFRANSAQVLLTTSLIEVGVDVPNATVMLIDNAEQFGLAQLHQLRGRIGRGAQEAYCILVALARGKEAQQRLRVLEETTDGFRIAEADLKIRGPGELLGQQQSGAPRFRFGDLANDLDLIEQARRMAAELPGE